MPKLRPLAAVVAALAFTLAAFSQTTTYTWTGNAAVIQNDTGSANATDSGNWAAGNLPQPSRTNTILNFGASSGLTSEGVLNLSLPEYFEAFGVVFNAPMPAYQLGSGFSGNLGLGAGGVTVNGDGHVFLYSNLLLYTNQTWNIAGGAYAYGQITEDNAFTKITKTGPGYLVLNNDSNTFTGGVDVQSGALYVGGSSGMEGSAIFSGPVGTGTLTLRDNTSLRTNTYSGVTLHNDIQLGNNVTLGDQTERNSMTLAGNITPLQTSTTLYLGNEGATFFTGSLGDAIVGGNPAPTAYRFTTPPDYDSLGFAVLAGSNTYSGGTIADRAAVIFFAPGSIPSTGSISAVNGGYVGAGFNGGMSTILSHITDPTAFEGSLGFDTDPENSVGPNIFNDTLDLSSFAPDGGNPQGGFWGLGSQTFAIITGQITPPTGGNFVFGGGEGTLYVQSNLGQSQAVGLPGNATGAPVGVRVRSDFADRPLTVWLQGDNAYNGNLMSDHSIVVLDSPNALPASSHFQMDSRAYVGMTENTGLTPNQFISRLQSPSYTDSSVIGFDSTNPEGRTITDSVDLSALGNIYLGTTTHVHLAGPIRAPSTGQLSLAGIAGGWLSIDSPLTPTVVIGENPPVSGVDSVQIGMNGVMDTFQRGIVELGSDASTYAGGTQLQSGYLLIGSSSTGTGGAPTSGPLGTGTLSFYGLTTWVPTALVTTTANPTLHNNISFGSQTMAQFGVDLMRLNDDRNDPTDKLRAYVNNGLTLAGNLSGNPSEVLFTGNGTFTLSGDNSGLFTSEFDIGRALYTGDGNIVGSNTAGGVAGGVSVNGGTSYSTPLVIAASNNALGNTNSMICLSNGADLQFTTSAPVVGSIMGGSPIYFDGVADRSYVSLASGSTLTIHQNQDGELAANIGGGVSDRFSSNATLAAVNATLVKTGQGTLTLSGQNTYSGGTVINAGTVVAGSSTQVDQNSFLITSGPLGTGTVTLNGGTLGFTHGASIVNNIAFGPSGGTLAGNTTFTQLLTIGTGVTLAPGNSPGTMIFANGLTLAGGGTFSLDIADMSLSAGVGYDNLLLPAGLLTVTATSANPFTLQLNSLTALDGGIGLLGATPTGPYSLTILESSTSLAGLWGTNGNSFDNITLNTSNFSSAQPGVFSLSLGAEDTKLMLNFTPVSVPEPSTYALLGFGLLAVAYTVRRRRA